MKYLHQELCKALCMDRLIIFAQCSCKTSTLCVVFTQGQSKAQRHAVACHGLHRWPVTALRCKPGLSDSQQ